MRQIREQDITWSDWMIKATLLWLLALTMWWPATMLVLADANPTDFGIIAICVLVAIALIAWIAFPIIVIRRKETKQLPIAIVMGVVLNLIWYAISRNAY